MRKNIIEVVKYQKEFKKYNVYYINTDNQLEEVPVVYTRRLSLLGDFYVLYNDLDMSDKENADIIRLKNISIAQPMTKKKKRF